MRGFWIGIYLLFPFIYEWRQRRQKALTRDAREFRLPQPSERGIVACRMPISHLCG